MKIIELRASNFARLSAVAIRPDGALVQVTGKNSQGKTTVLNAIWTALVGRTVAPPRTIKDGADEATLHLDLGELVIKRTFKPGKGATMIDTLTVTRKGGDKVRTSPQAMIDALLGDLTFNPLEFARLAPQKQFDRVKGLVPDFDFEDNAEKRKAAFDDRTEMNRRHKAAQVQVDAIQLPPGPKPDRIDVADMMAQIDQAIQTNHEIDVEAKRQQSALDQAEVMLDEAERLHAKAASMEKEASEKIIALKKLPALPKRVDTGPMRDKLGQAEKVLGIITMFENRERYLNEVISYGQQSAELTGIIETLDEIRRQAVADADMPVEGLAFGDGEVLLGGRPFASAGTAEKIRASVGIGMALNPQLRVMLIDEGSELDSEGLALIGKLAEAKDYQVWVARVAEGDAAKVGFQIVDGALAQ